MLLAAGTPVRKLADYFDNCRRKRNKIDYTQSRLATDTEAEEILARAGEFVNLLEAWIARNHPKLAR